MKKWLLLIMVPLMAFMISFSSCSSDDDDNNPTSEFNYSGELLYGTWKITKCAGIVWTRQTTTATFGSDGSYSGEGYFGTASGTYIAKGDSITCYINGELYCTYEVISLTGNTVELNMIPASGTTSLRLVCTKVS